MTTCINYAPGPGLARELENFIDDCDAIRLMELLMELKDAGTFRGVLTDADRSELTRLNYLLAAIARDQKSQTT